MQTDAFLSSPEWRDLRDRALARDGKRCLVARLLGGDCSGVLAAHHIKPRSTHPELALDLDNVGTTCAAHHPRWEAFARALRIVEGVDLPPCGHSHPYAAGREECERRRRREAERKRLARLAPV